MLKVECSDVFYGKNHVLYNVDLQLDYGIYGLIGENGAGKTTFIGLITGLLKPKKGRVLWNDVEIGKLGRKYYDNVGYLPQFPALYGEFYPIEFLYYMAELKGMKKKEYKDRADKLLDFVGLGHERKKRICQFSGGMRQRLGIAQALLNNPKLLILDEPTAGLDPRERIRFKNIITELSKDKIVILATHIISDIENIANEIIFLSQGSIISKLTADEMLAELEGKVYTAKIDEYTYETIDRSLISRVINCNDSYMVRGFIKGIQGAVETKPTLEDVFLYKMLEINEGCHDKI